jgi:outer membrane biosynthesis protein TonB
MSGAWAVARSARFRWSVPWIVSLALHVAAIGAVALVLVNKPALPPAAPALELLVVGTGSGPRAGTGGGGSPSTPRERWTGPTARTASTSSRTTYESPRGTTTEASAGMASTAPALPAMQEVLSDVPSSPAAPAYSGTGGGDPGASPFGWEGPTRRVLRKRNPVFPTILSAAGQEVEIEARITVTPAGTVSRVEIVRGSGYIEIDARVKEALLDHLFSRVDGRENEVGTTSYRFRLER